MPNLPDAEKERRPTIAQIEASINRGENPMMDENGIYTTEAERLISAHDPEVIVQEDGSCVPVDWKTRALAAEAERDRMRELLRQFWNANSLGLEILASDESYILAEAALSEKGVTKG